MHEIPLLFSPPWINKYYIMDLAPGRSLVQWAVDHGHTVFMISYRNPDEAMRDVSAWTTTCSPARSPRSTSSSEITGADKVNLLGLCLGGTLTMVIAGLPGRRRAGPDQLSDLPQHLDRLQRAGRCWASSPTRHSVAGWNGR